MFVEQKDTREIFSKIYPSFLKQAAVLGTLFPVQGIPEYQAIMDLGEEAISPILEIVVQRRETAAALLLVLFDLTNKLGIEQPKLSLFDTNASVDAIATDWIQWGIESGRMKDPENGIPLI